MAFAYTDAQIIHSLRMCHGIVTQAAKWLGCKDLTIYRRIKESPEVGEACRMARERTLDLAENKLIEKLKAGSESSIHFTLRTLGKDRGYVERREERIGGDASAPPVRVEGLIDVDSLDLPLDVRRQMLDAIRKKKAGGTEDNEEGEEETEE